MNATIRIDQIVYSGRGAIHARSEVNQFVVGDYAELRKNGVKMPPVALFRVNSKLVLADGRHRIEAAVANGEKQIECVVHEGDISAARAFAAGANVDHGLRRTNADKLACVKLLLSDGTWSTRSDNLIAIQCGVSHPFVAKVRSQLETVASCGRRAEPAKRVGKDGKARKAKKNTQPGGGAKKLSVAPAVSEQLDPVVNEPAGVAPVSKAMVNTLTKSIIEAEEVLVDHSNHGDAQQADATMEATVDSTLGDAIASVCMKVRIALKAVADEHLAAVLAAVRAELDRIEERAGQECVA